MPNETRTGIAIGGAGFMGKAHARAILLAQPVFDLASQPVLKLAIARDLPRLSAFRRRFGIDAVAVLDADHADWDAFFAEHSAEIRVFANLFPNNLAVAPTVAAAKAGMDVLRDKPVGRNANEAFEVWSKVAQTPVVAMAGFNYRFVPALLLAAMMWWNGEFGEVVDVDAQYRQCWGFDPEDAWRFDRNLAGSGATGDLASHLVDAIRFVTAIEVARVSSVTQTLVRERGGRSVDVDDAVSSLIEMENGAPGRLHASRVSNGKNGLKLKIVGTGGAFEFDLERLNALKVWEGSPTAEPRTISVTQAEHPFISHQWPPGHVLGWWDTFLHQWGHFLGCVDARQRQVGPVGATLRDAYHAAEVCDTMLKSAFTQRWERVRYAELTDRAR